MPADVFDPELGPVLVAVDDNDPAAGLECAAVELDAPPVPSCDA